MRENDTYEFNGVNELEPIEWDDIWRQNAPDVEAPRILLIGDSISRSYRKKLNEIFNNEIYADQLSTSKSIADSSYLDLLDYMKLQCDRYDVIVFNNGLHGFYLETAAYEKCYRKAVLHLKEIFPKAKIIIALSTPCRNRNNLNEFLPVNDSVIERNKAACKIAKENKLEFIDLYSLLCNRPELFIEDGAHLKESGQALLAEECAKAVRKILS